MTLMSISEGYDALSVKCNRGCVWERWEEGPVEIIDGFQIFDISLCCVFKGVCDARDEVKLKILKWSQIMELMKATKIFLIRMKRFFLLFDEWFRFSHTYFINSSRRRSISSSLSFLISCLFFSSIYERIINL